MGRTASVAAGVLAVGALLVALACGGEAPPDPISYYVSPAELAGKDGPTWVAGVVSDLRTHADIEIEFALSADGATVQVRCNLGLPGGMADGRSVAAHGVLGPDGVFVADEIAVRPLELP